MTAEIQRLVSGRGREDIMRLENDVKQLQHNKVEKVAGNGNLSVVSVPTPALDGLDKLVGARSPLASTFNNSSVEDVSVVVDALSSQSMLADLTKRSNDAADYMRVGRSLKAQGVNFHSTVHFSDLVFKKSIVSGATEKALLAITDQTLLLMSVSDRKINWESSLVQLTTLTITKDEGDETFMIEMIDGDRIVLESPRRDIAVGAVIKYYQALGVKLSLIQNSLGIVISRDF